VENAQDLNFLQRSILGYVSQDRSTDGEWHGDFKTWNFDFLTVKSWHIEVIEASTVSASQTW